MLLIINFKVKDCCLKYTIVLYFPIMLLYYTVYVVVVVVFKRFQFEFIFPIYYLHNTKAFNMKPRAKQNA